MCDKLENVGHSNLILSMYLALIEMHVCITHESSVITQKAEEALIGKENNDSHFKNYRSNLHLMCRNKMQKCIVRINMKFVLSNLWPVLRKRRRCRCRTTTATQTHVLCQMHYICHEQNTNYNRYTWP